MLFPIPLHPIPEEIVEIKAFGYYLSGDLLPRNQLGTVYFARKTLSDGSTVTLVRSIAQDRNPAFHVTNEGYGRIERDPLGQVTKIVAHTASRAPGGLFRDMELKTDPEGKGPLRGWVRSQSGADGTLVLPEELDYSIDSMEALAFGNLAQGCVVPEPVFGLPDGSRPFVDRYFPVEKGIHTYALGNRHEAFRFVALAHRWAGATMANVPSTAGTLLFRLDGTLAAYMPRFGPENTPAHIYPEGAGTVSAQSISDTRELTGQVFVPIPVSDSDRQTISASF